MYAVSFSASAQITITDDQGTEITLEKPAERVISLAPHLTEQVYAAGAGNTLVAVSSYSDYPVEAKSLPEVGDAFRVDMEQIVALKPDLVLAWASGTPTAAIQQMRALGFSVAVFEPQSLQDIATNLVTIGRLTGNEASAQQAAKDFFKRLADLRQQYADKTPVRVFFEISARPLFTINGDHFINDVLTLCGGTNIFADLTTLAPAVSMEAVLARDPQAI
ncbi:MAG TPA: cobalamin-binding protein, partial [Gammaproteobacteria bacterium]|nr:cobalamin-binding protein [Gammaproteobacteria bacterium]